MSPITPRSIVVTGGCGFIGSNLILQLIAAGHQVLNIDCLTYAANPASLATVESNPNYRFAKLNINARADVSKLLTQWQPHWIMHLAAETHVDRSIDSADAFADSNVQGTQRLLDACLNYWRGLDANQRKEFRFLHVSTDEVYGSLGPEGSFNETSAFRPRSPYAASKAASDHFVNAWIETYSFPAMVTHSSNNYGPHQFPEKLIPMVVLKCLQREQIPVYGTGENIRDWIFVEDHCAALQAIMMRGRLGQTYNIGGQCELRNIDLVQHICQMLDELLLSPSRNTDRAFRHSSLIEFVRDRPGHDYRYSLDLTKICTEVGWKPDRNWQSNLKRTVQWYVENPEWWQPIAGERYLLNRLGLRDQH